MYATSKCFFIFGAALFASAAAGPLVCLEAPPGHPDYPCQKGTAIIDLEQCQLTNKDLDNLATCFDTAGRLSITQILLFDNGITKIPEDFFTGLTSLEILDVGSNPLKALSADIFQDLTSLTELLLNNIQLSRVPFGLFYGLSTLQRLILADNELEMLPFGAFSSLTSLGTLNLGGNDDLQCVPPVGNPSAFVQLPDDFESDGASCDCPPEGVDCEFDGLFCFPGAEGYRCRR